MRFLHSMIRVTDIEKSIEFFVGCLGLREVRRKEVPQGKFTLIFLATQEGGPEIELTYNWDSDEVYTQGRNFGHLAFEVDNIYEKCELLRKKGIKILRPPRDGYMAFIKSPDEISIELLQKGEPLPLREPWMSMLNCGEW